MDEEHKLAQLHKAVGERLASLGDRAHERRTCMSACKGSISWGLTVRDNLRRHGLGRCREVALEASGKVKGKRVLGSAPMYARELRTSRLAPKKTACSILFLSRAVALAAEVNFFACVTPSCTSIVMMPPIDAIATTLDAEWPGGEEAMPMKAFRPESLSVMTSSYGAGRVSYEESDQLTAGEGGHKDGIGEAHEGRLGAARDVETRHIEHARVGVGEVRQVDALVKGDLLSVGVLEDDDGVLRLPPVARSPVLAMVRDENGELVL